MIKVGIMGFGGMGHAHAAVYGQTKNAKVVALWDANPALLDPKSKIAINIPTGEVKLDWKNLKTYTSAKKFLADPEVDLVDICVPTHLHSKYVIMAARAGKNILSEKPMARTVAQAEQALKEVRKAKVKWMVAQCIRFWPEYDYLKKIYDSKKLGKLITLCMRRYSVTPTWSQKDWILKGRQSGGALLDLHVHDVDFAYYLLGKPKAVRAAGLKKMSGDYDLIYSQLIYDGCVVNAEGQWLMTAGFNMYYLATFEKGVVEFDCARMPMLTTTIGDKVTHPKVSTKTGWHLEIEYYLKCLERNQQPKLCMPESSLESLKIAIAEKKAADSGKTVRV